jgi:hypothetical protein
MTAVGALMALACSLGVELWLVYAGLSDTQSSTGALAVVWGPVLGLFIVSAIWLADRFTVRVRLHSKPNTG